jgi:hypothetical protein
LLDIERVVFDTRAWEATAATLYCVAGLTFHPLRPAISCLASLEETMRGSAPIEVIDFGQLKIRALD